MQRSIGKLRLAQTLKLNGVSNHVSLLPMVRRREPWLSGKEHLLLLQRTRV